MCSVVKHLCLHFQIIEDAEKQNKISELYDLVHQSQSMAAALPEVVDRLEALQGLHDQGKHPA